MRTVERRYQLLLDKPPSVVLARGSSAENRLPLVAGETDTADDTPQETEEASTFERRPSVSTWAPRLTSAVQSVPPKRIPHQELLYKEQVIDNKSEYDFKLCDIFLGMFFVLAFVWDVGSDIHIAVVHFTNQDLMYGVVTVVPVLLAYLMVFGFALVEYGLCKVELSKYFPYVSRYQEKVAWWIWVIRIVCLILGLAPIIRTIDFLRYGFKSMQAKDKEERERYRQHTLDVGLAMSSMKLLESYMESALQLCLQLYIMFKTFSQMNAVDVTISTSAILSSWLSLALSAVTLYKFKRMYNSSSGKLSVPAQLIKILWRAFETGGRVLCMTLFASMFEYLIIGILLPHVLFVAFWDIKRNSEKLQSRRGCIDSNLVGARELQNDRIMMNWKTVVSGVLLGYVSVFYFPVSFGPRGDQSKLPAPTRYAFFGFYLVFYAENIFMLTLWALMTSVDDVWYIRLGILTVVIFSFLHFVTQFAYYKYFHPKNHLSEHRVHTRIIMCNCEAEDS